jgi:dTDP-4-amino-4,6-dideoxygalactose transaminase
MENGTAALAARMRDEFLVFGRPMLGEAEIAEVTGSIRAGWIGTGPKVHQFERMLEEYIGVEHVRCVSSCTAALILGMEVLGVGPGDEVLVPSMTFVASANAIEHTGATPVFVDSDPRTGLIDLDQAEAAIGERTAAIMPVHLSGRPVDLDHLARLRDRYGIKIVEDAAHALGTQWHGRQIGSFGNLAAYSFYVTKNITTIEGGAIATDDPAVAAKVEQLSLHGLSLGAWQRFSDKGFRHYEVEKPGYKYNMTDVQAAFGLQQLPQLDGWIDVRAEQWERYTELLAGLPLELPADPEADTLHARHLYQVQVGPDAPMGRDELLDYLTSQKIGSGVHYRGVHLHPYYRDRYGIAAEALPVAARISDTTLSLPLSPAVTEADQLDVVGALIRALTPRSGARLARRRMAGAAR